MFTDAGETVGRRRRDLPSSLKLVRIISLVRLFSSLLFSLFLSSSVVFVVWVRGKKSLQVQRLRSLSRLTELVLKLVKEEAFESYCTSSPKFENCLITNLRSSGSRIISGSFEESTHRTSTTTFSLPPCLLMPVPQGINTKLSHLLLIEALISWSSWLSFWTIPMKTKSSATANDVDLKYVTVFHYGLGSSSRPIKNSGPSSFKYDKGFSLLAHIPIIYESWFDMLEVIVSMLIIASSQLSHHSHPFTTFSLPGDGLIPVLASLRCITAPHSPFRFSYRIRLPPLQYIVSPLCRYRFGEEIYWTVHDMSKGSYYPNLCPTPIPSPGIKLVKCFIGLHTVRTSINAWMEMSRLATSSLWERPLQYSFFSRSEMKLTCVFAELFSWLGISRLEETNESASAFFGGETSSLTSLQVTTFSLGSHYGSAGTISSTHLDLSPSSLSMDQALSISIFIVFKLFYQNVRGRIMPSCCMFEE